MAQENGRGASTPTDALARYEGTRQGALDQKNRLKNIREKLDCAKQEKAHVQEVLKTQKTNLILAVDATASREFFWSETIKIQDKMIEVVAKSGANLQAQLVNYSGATQNGELAKSPWHNHAYALCEYMRSIHCVAGGTQIEKVFRHALSECCKRTVNALILVGDSCEEDSRSLIDLARQVNQKGIKFFMFHDTRSTCSAGNTLTTFKQMAKAAEGFYVPFNVGDLAILGDYLKAVGALATQNETVINHTRTFIETPEGRDLIDRATRKLGFHRTNSPK